MAQVYKPILVEIPLVISAYKPHTAPTNALRLHGGKNNVGRTSLLEVAFRPYAKSTT
jgi:hypothetical protein